MIKTMIHRLLGKVASPAAAGSRPPSNPFGERQDVPLRVHGIDRELLDRRALEVVSTLQDNGYEAYIVGGAVRDLLLGLRPKDFDVATNATPEEVKALFRRAFIIGRRFRIVHVVFGRGREHEVIEVTTFRAFLDNTAASKVSGNEKTNRKALEGVQHAVDANGRVLRDNVWGTLPEDATRRDFSINAMYYDPITEVVVDFHHGIADSQKRQIRMIGEPAARYREDPVRILRAIRFVAKLDRLGFALEPRTAQPLKELQGLLADIPPSRMFDEMLKLLQTGHALASIAQLRKLHLEHGIYPLLDLTVEREHQPLIHQALADTDRRVAEGKPVAPSFLLACILWQDVGELWRLHQDEGQPAHPALQQAIDEAFERRVGDVSGRGRLAADMREIWTMQPRFEKRAGRAPHSLVQQPRFRAGLDFLRLRSHAGEVDAALVQWWETFSQADADAQFDLLQQAKEQTPPGSPKTSRSRKRKPKTATESPAMPTEAGTDIPAPAHEAGDAAALEPDTASPAKKRRRRRKRSADASSGESGTAAPQDAPAADDSSATGTP